MKLLKKMAAPRNLTCHVAAKRRRTLCPEALNNGPVSTLLDSYPSAAHSLRTVHEFCEVPRNAVNSVVIRQDSHFGRQLS
jgi:hypothetical protein